MTEHGRAARDSVPPAFYAQARTAFADHREAVARAMLPVLASVGAAGAAVIRRLWRDETAPSVRRRVVEAAGAGAGRWVRPLIREALRDPAMTVRFHARLVIHHRRDRRLVAEALPLAADASGGIRTNCMALLADLKPDGWRAAVQRRSRDPKAYVRAQCRRILAAARAGGAPRRRTPTKQ
jgi:hypothetical protein